MFHNLKFHENQIHILITGKIKIIRCIIVYGKKTFHGHFNDFTLLRIMKLIFKYESYENIHSIQCAIQRIFSFLFFILLFTYRATQNFSIIRICPTYLSSRICLQRLQNKYVNYSELDEVLRLKTN